MFSRIYSVVQSISCWTALALSLLLAIFTQRERFYHFDVLFLAESYDYFVTHWSFSGWEFPDAGYFFPDMLLFFVLRCLLDNLHITYVAYAAVQTIGFTLAIILSVKKVMQAGEDLHLLALLIVTTYLLFLSIPGYFARPNILEPHRHFGAVVMLFVGLVIALRVTDSDTGKMCLDHLFLFVLITITVASDFLFAVQFVVPLLLATSLVAFLGRIQFSTAVILCGSGFLGVPVGTFFHRITNLCGTMYDRAHFNLAALPASVQRLYQMGGAAWTAHPIASMIWMLFMVLASAMVIRALAAKIRGTTQRPRRVDKRLLLVLSFFVFCVASNISATVITGVIRMGYSMQYLIPTLIIPVFFGWPFVVAAYGWLARAYARVGRHLIIVVCVALILKVLFLPVFPSVGSISKVADYYPSGIESLDRELSKRGLKRGIAQFWQSRVINILSKKGIKTVPGMQVFSDLQPHYKNTCFDSFDLDVDYVVIDLRSNSAYQFDETAIRRRFGPPAESFRCKLGRVLVFNRDQDDKFRSYFARLNRRFRDLGSPGGTAAFSGQELVRELSYKAASGTEENVSEPQTYVVSTGYIRLPRGKYSIEIEYDLPENHPPNKPVGKWFVRSCNEWAHTYRMVGEGELSGSAGRVSSSFDLGSGLGRRLIVIGVSSRSPEGPSVRNIRLRRIL